MDVLEEDRMLVQFMSAMGFDEDGIVGELIYKHFLRSNMINEKDVININVLLKYKYTYGYQLENGDTQSVADFVHANMVK